MGLLKQVCDFLANAIQSKVHARMSIEEWFQSLQHQGDVMLSKVGVTAISPHADIIQRVIHYVDQHFMEEISLGTLANEYNVTPNYLSTLFHKKNGITFVKYLTNIRMLKAKELLITKPELKVQDVAEAVGYFSHRHFTKLFIEYFKCYPSEIRERNG
jgi:two-component system response regulator YesN